MTQIAQPSIVRTIRQLIYFECLQSWRQSAELLNPLLFYIIVISLFAVASGADPKILHALAPGIIWVGALLASLLTQERLFMRDWQQGSLSQWLLSPQPLSILILAKMIAHWLVTGLPLILVTPLLGVLLHLQGYSQMILLLSLLLGTPVLSFVGAIAAALVVGVRGSGLLLPLLLLPLYIPVLIFGVLAVNAAMDGGTVNAPLAMLAACLVLTLTLAPLASASALKIGVE